MQRTEQSCCRRPGLGAGAVREGDMKMEQKGMMRDQWVGEARSVTELAAEGGGDSCQRPAPGWFRNMQCGADGVRGSPCGCENTELRSGSAGVWDQPQAPHQQTEGGTCVLLRAGRWVLTCQSDLFGLKDWRERRAEGPGLSLWCPLTGRMLRGRAGAQEGSHRRLLVSVAFTRFFGGTFPHGLMSVFSPPVSDSGPIV